MARLQKKKTVIDKSKKKKVDSSEGSALGFDKNKKNSDTSAPRQSSSPALRSQKKVDSVGEPGVIQKWIRFFREVRVELKKVTWPNRKQTAASTVVVIVLVFIIAAFLGLVDFSLSKLVQVVLA